MIRAGLMEKIMSKSNDTTKTRELTEAELAAVSGGYILQNTMVSSVVAVGGRTGGYVDLSCTDILFH